MASPEQEKQSIEKEIKALKSGLLTVVEKQQEEIDKLGQARDKTADKIDKADQRYVALMEEYKSHQQVMTEQLEAIEKKLARPNMYTPADVEARSIGDLFVNSSGYKDWRGPDSRSVKSLQGSCGDLELKGLRQIQAVTQVIADMESKGIASGGAANLRDVLSTERLQTIFFDPLRPNRVRDLIPTINTNLALVEYLREKSYTNAAAPVTEGNLKPESAIDIDIFQAPMQVIAHHMIVARQLLEDVGALREYIDQRLFDGLKQVEDVQILYGSGAAPNLTGIMTTTGVQTYNWSSGLPQHVGGSTIKDTKIDAIRKAMTKSQLAYYPVTGIVMHPTDWQDVELTKSSQGLYLWVNISTGAQPTLWRVPVVVTTAINQGDCLIGSFRMGTILWDRQMANMRMSDSHSDIFLRNQLCLLMEERLAQTVVLPKSFVHITFDWAHS